MVLTFSKVGNFITQKNSPPRVKRNGLLFLCFFIRDGFYPRPLPDELFRSADLLRVALPRLFCERLLVETFGRDEDWLFTVVLRLGRLARCVSALARLVRAGVARCVRVDDWERWLAVGLLTWCTVGVADWFWRAGRVARLVASRELLPRLRTEFVFGSAVRVRVAGAVASRVRLLPLVRTASRLPFVRAASVLRPVAERTLRLSVFRVAAPRVAVVVFRLLAAREVAARPFVVRLAERTVDASATREGRADERLLRSTSGR